MHLAYAALCFLRFQGVLHFTTREKLGSRNARQACICLSGITAGLACACSRFSECLGGHTQALMAPRLPSGAAAGAIQSVVTGGCC